MARSLAFWVENPSQVEKEVTETNRDGKSVKEKESFNTDVELHFNYWSLKEGSVNYLDVGVRLSKVGRFDSLNFYFPFDFDSLTYQPQLGVKICNDHELISAVFNSPVIKSQPNGATGVFDITLSDREEQPLLRFITQLQAAKKDSPGGVVIEAQNDDEKGNGCTLRFPENLFSFKDGVDGYFRFRIVLSKSDKKNISSVHKPRGALLTNHFEKSEIVDFRINESRNIPEKIRKKLSGESHIHKVHFFLIRDASSEYKMGNSKYDRCRLLEEDLWNKYLDIDSVKGQDQMLIYHWKDKAESEKGIDHFASFAKFTQRKVTGWDLLLIIVLIFVFGVGSSLLTNFIWSNGDSDVQCDTLALICDNSVKLEQPPADNSPKGLKGLAQKSVLNASGTNIQPNEHVKGGELE